MVHYNLYASGMKCIFVLSYSQNVSSLRFTGHIISLTVKRNLYMQAEGINWQSGCKKLSVRDG